MGYKKRISEAMWSKTWEEYEKMLNRDDNIQVGDTVKYKGEKFFVKELCGVNIQGQHEYYIEKGDGVDCAYVFDYEISKFKSEPPEVPAVAKCKHVNAYQNKFHTFSFWVCPDCKQELTDRQILEQSEIDILLEEMEKLLG